MDDVEKSEKVKESKKGMKANRREARRKCTRKNTALDEIRPSQGSE